MQTNRLSISLMFFITFLVACSKGGDSGNPSTPGSGGGTGGTTTTPIIVKTMGVNSVSLLMDSANRITRLDVTNGFGNTIRFVSGNTQQIELVNSNTEPRTEIGRYASTVYYANVKTGDITTSLNVSAGDSASNLFFRVKNFDATKTQFNNLNIILCSDGVNNPGTIVLGYNMANAAAPGASLLTSQALKTLFNTKLDRIQLVIGGVPYY